LGITIAARNMLDFHIPKFEGGSCVTHMSIRTLVFHQDRTKDLKQTVKGGFTVDEERLWTAVLLQAIRDVGGFDIVADENHRAARLWFLSDNHAPGSYRWICDVLNLPPDYLRHRLFAVIARPDWNQRRPRRLRISVAKGMRGEGDVYAVDRGAAKVM
jgi:hypothetical protein